jgi:hypothetical protein
MTKVPSSLDELRRYGDLSPILAVAVLKLFPEL